MNGTEKQISYAENIRARFQRTTLAQAERMMRLGKMTESEYEMAQEAMARACASQNEAAWWIDHQHEIGKLLDAEYHAALERINAERQIAAQITEPEAFAESLEPVMESISEERRSPEGFLLNAAGGIDLGRLAEPRWGGKREGAGRPEGSGKAAEKSAEYQAGYQAGYKAAERKYSGDYVLELYAGRFTAQEIETLLSEGFERVDDTTLRYQTAVKARDVRLLEALSNQLKADFYDRFVDRFGDGALLTSIRSVPRKDEIV